MAAVQAEAMAKAIEHQQELNRLAAGYYVCGVAGLIIISVTVTNIGHLSSGRFRDSSLIKKVSQHAAHLLTGYQVGEFLVMPHWMFAATAFIGLNVGLVAWQLPWTNLASVGARIGWMALCNMCLVIFLGLKNTPLSPLAGKTYRDLNVLHRFCGYVTVIEIILHASLFSSGLIKIHVWSELQSTITYAGAVAGVSMLIIALTATWFFRRKFYETFYMLHVLFVVVILIAMGFHQPDIRQKGLIVVIVSAVFWGLDRMIRATRWLYNGHHGHCTLQALPHGATRIIMAKSIRARPGSHAILWLPSVGLMEQHPFSVLSNDPLEFVVVAHGDYTRKLHQIACQEPGLRCRVSLDGPYGRVPDVNSFDRVLLISGGSGVTFAMALAMEWLRQNDEMTSRSLHFVWVVRSTNQFKWFLPSLAKLRAHPKVTLALHVTSELTEDLADAVQSTGSTSPAISDMGTPTIMPDLEKGITTDQQLMPGSTDEKSAHHSTPVVRALLDSQASPLHTFHRGRPIVELLFDEAMTGASPNDTILVTGSGPAQLLSDIQAATSSAIKINGPAIRLHLEAYEW